MAHVHREWSVQVQAKRNVWKYVYYVMLWSSWEVGIEEECFFSLYPLRFSNGNLQTKLTNDQLTKAKGLFCSTWELIKEVAGSLNGSS